MLLLILFCKLIEAVTDSEKKAVAALTNEFMEPFSSMMCLENPDPDIWLWNDIPYIDDPEAQDKPDYEHITKDNYKEKLEDKENIIVLPINEVSHEDKINVRKIKQTVGEGTSVLSMDQCFRPGQKSTRSTPDIYLINRNNTDLQKVSIISLINPVSLSSSVGRKLWNKKCLMLGRRD